MYYVEYHEHYFKKGEDFSMRLGVFSDLEEAQSVIISFQKYEFVTSDRVEFASMGVVNRVGYKEEDFPCFLVHKIYSGVGVFESGVEYRYLFFYDGDHGVNCPLGVFCDEPSLSSFLDIFDSKPIYDLENGGEFDEQSGFFISSVKVDYQYDWSWFDED